jgi:protein-L-isoaspartate O-methyltransferase
METSPHTSWDELITQVPRKRFIPDVIWRWESERVGNVQVPVNRHKNAPAWEELADLDAPVTIQVDYGKLDEDGSGWEPTSFCPDHTVTQRMLAALIPAPGMRVLEIGTGSGWTAALMAAAGAEVTSIEIDPELAHAARGKLAGRAGNVTVITGDGEEGWPAGAPYDALIASVGTWRVLPAWVEQTRVGGRLVVPLTGDWYPPGLAVLERTNDGAVGRLGGPAAFDVLRGQAPHRIRGVDFTIPMGPGRTTDVHPFDLLKDVAAATAIGQRVSGITQAWSAAPGSRAGTLWFYAEDSWATLSTLEGPPYQVSQAGPRRLYDEVEAGYLWWVQQGRPGIDAWRVAVDRTGQQRLYLEV